MLYSPRYDNFTCDEITNGLFAILCFTIKFIIIHEIIKQIRDHFKFPIVYLNIFKKLFRGNNIINKEE